MLHSYHCLLSEAGIYVDIASTASGSVVLQAVPSWFVKVTDFKDRLLAANSGTYWVPRHVKDGRFYNWLESARDW